MCNGRIQIIMAHCFDSPIPIGFDNTQKTGQFRYFIEYYTLAGLEVSDSIRYYVTPWVRISLSLKGYFPKLYVEYEVGTF